MPLLLALALFTGCSQDQSDLAAYVAEVKARKSTAIEPIPDMRAYQLFTYVPGDRRQPFVPFVERREQSPDGVSGFAPNFQRPREPLEGFGLDTLRMAGTMTVAGRRYALIKAPDGIVYRVSVGDHMGQNLGEIVAIDDQGAQLVEIVPDGLGGYMRREASLAVSEGGGKR